MDFCLLKITMVLDDFRRDLDAQRKMVAATLREAVNSLRLSKFKESRSGVSAGLLPMC